MAMQCIAVYSCIIVLSFSAQLTSYFYSCIKFAGLKMTRFTAVAYELCADIKFTLQGSN